MPAGQTFVRSDAGWIRREQRLVQRDRPAEVLERGLFVALQAKEGSALVGRRQAAAVISIHGILGEQPFSHRELITLSLHCASGVALQLQHIREGLISRPEFAAIPLVVRVAPDKVFENCEGGARLFKSAREVAPAADRARQHFAWIGELEL